MTKRCPRCDKHLPLTAYHFHASGKDRGRPLTYCKVCGNAMRRESAKRNPEKWRAAARAYRAKHVEKFREISRRAGAAFRKRLRAEVLAAYGGECACCGEKREQFLAVDHTHGGGQKHKASVGNRVYHWLKKNGWPLGFRLLCHNCNQSRGAYGVCPHEVEAYDLPFAVRMEA